ncbi:RTA1 domain-containing protein [Phanerochaete sordida]|uniref:RTA1 domain-containing protein n=1 Tax=Phanerochaete sordida TaxID=48140 RepID=A0A9P3GEC9_9APHY|nr:RTA1 domain-containing protein [Phanerochaete sordida]
MNSTAQPERVLASASPYHYTPTRAVCILFVILFAVSTLWHAFNGVRYRLWWVFPTIFLAGGGETAGWIGRTMSSYNVTNRSGFMIQIVCLILAPTPLLASIFIIFSNLAQKIGTSYSRLTPRLYSRVFLTCDIIALVIQGGGGGIAAGAVTESSQKLGSNVMLIGIIFQTVAMVVFMLLATEFFVRYAANRPARPGAGGARAYGAALHPKVKLMAIGTSAATLFLFVRAIYRLFELADGWNGPINSTQWYFDVFDGGMITLAMYSLNVFHPGPLLFAVPDDAAAADAQKQAYATVDSLPMKQV